MKSLIEKVEARLRESNVWSGPLYDQDEADLRELLEEVLEKLKELEFADV